MAVFKCLLALSFVQLAVQEQRPKPSSYDDNDQADSFYSFSGPSDDSSYAKASSECRKDGGHLAVFNSKGELEYVKDTAIMLSKKAFQSQLYNYWVGYTGSSWMPMLAIAEAAYSNYTFQNIDNDGLGAPVAFNTENNIPQVELLLQPDFKMATYGGGENVPGGFLCEREKDTCGCSKVNEPVIRTFDGQPIQLDAYCQYTLIDKPQYKVEIRTIPAIYDSKKKTDRTNPNHVSLFPHLGVFVDEVRITDRSQDNKLYILTWSNEDGEAGSRIYVFKSDGSIEHVGESGAAVFKVGHMEAASWSDSVVKLEVLPDLVARMDSSILSLKTNPVILSIQRGSDPPSVSIYYDGVNADVRMLFDDVKTPHVKGLCGTCNDEKKLIDSDGDEVTSTYAHGYSWISSKDQCPASMYRPAACASDLMYRRAVERCQPLIDYKGEFNMKTDGCISKYVTRHGPLKDRNNLFTACVSTTCEFGPKASCYYFKKALWLCGHADPDKFLTEKSYPLDDLLGCNPDKICYEGEVDSSAYYDSVSFNGTCFRKRDPGSAVTAFTAERYCQTWYGHMVTVHSKEEHDYLVGTFVNGPSKPPGSPPYQFWLGRVVGNQQEGFTAFNKEANLDGSRLDYSIADAKPIDSSNDGPCVAMGVDGGLTKVKCMDIIQGIVCAYKAYTPCGDTLCFHPHKCDQVSSTCYDPCFDEGFYNEGRCYSMFFLPHSPGNKTRPDDLPKLE